MPWRWLGPVICLAAAAWTWGGLHLSEEQPVWVLVGLDRLVGRDPVVQATWTWRILAAVGLVWGAVAYRSAKGGGDALADR